MRLKKIVATIKNYFAGNRLIVCGIKYIPVICTVLLTLHIALLLHGYYEVITVGVSAFLIVLLLILLSIRFKFCALHKAMIVYMVLNTICICVKRMEGFDADFLFCLRIAMFAFGVALVVLGIKKLYDNDCNK